MKNQPDTPATEKTVCFHQITDAVEKGKAMFELTTLGIDKEVLLNTLCQVQSSATVAHLLVDTGQDEDALSKMKAANRYGVEQACIVMLGLFQQVDSAVDDCLEAAHAAISELIADLE